MVNQTDEKNALEDISKMLVDIAVKEGERFRQENGREPTEAEAGRMAEEIIRLARTAVAMSK